MGFKFSKWIGYEFASNFEEESFPGIKFPNGLYPGSVSGYLTDIVKNNENTTTAYIVELRYRNSNYEEETQTIRFTYEAFKRTFYDATVLPETERTSKRKSR